MLLEDRTPVSTKRYATLWQTFKEAQNGYPYGTLGGREE